jgi:uncharacterized protein YjcR
MKLTKQDRITISELWVDGFTVDELALMYKVSIFRILGLLSKYGIEI